MQLVWEIWKLSVVSRGGRAKICLSGWWVKWLFSAIYWVQSQNNHRIIWLDLSVIVGLSCHIYVPHRLERSHNCHNCFLRSHEITRETMYWLTWFTTKLQVQNMRTAFLRQYRNRLIKRVMWISFYLWAYTVYLCFWSQQDSKDIWYHVQVWHWWITKLGQH